MNYLSIKNQFLSNQKGISQHLDRNNKIMLQKQDRVVINAKSHQNRSLELRIAGLESLYEISFMFKGAPLVNFVLNNIDEKCLVSRGAPKYSRKKPHEGTENLVKKSTHTIDRYPLQIVERNSNKGNYSFCDANKNLNVCNNSNVQKQSCAITD